MVTRQTFFRRIFPACILAAILIFNVVLVLVLVNYEEERANVRDAENFVKLGELYNHPENVQELYNMLAGETDANYQQIYTMAESVLSADEIREKTYRKNENQNLIITFGGLEWQVCNLSLTGNPGDEVRTPILTLLLSEARTLSKFQTWATGDTNVTYPCNIYGTSYVRAVTLNNGGQYATDANTLKSVNQNSRNQFAAFTMNDIKGSVTDAIIKPCEVKWQETESAPVVGVDGYNFYNDAWGTPGLDYLPDGVVDDYTERVGYDAWKDDYLWLPSISEIFGVWKLNSAQICCGYAYWLRSAPQDVFNTYSAMQIDRKGCRSYQPVHDGGYYILPALHLNLAAATMRASSSFANA